MMKNRLLETVTIVMVSTFSLVTASFAAEFNLAGTNVPGCDKIRGEAICLSISLAGPIEAGDTKKLQNEVARSEAYVSNLIGKARVVHLFLESPGGSMAEAMSLGRFIRSNQISTQVAKGEVCASACVMVLAAGVKRVPAGDVVIHSFYSPDVLGTNDFAKAEKLYAGMSETVASYLKEMRISNQLLEEMMRVPHFKSRKLELDELVKLGLLGIDPVYAQARNPSGTQIPAKK